MKRFRFRLQRILDFRTTEKKERESELAQKNYELRTAEEIREEILHAQDNTKAPHEQEATMAEFLLQGRYQERLMEALVQQRLMIIEAANAVDEARQAYVDKAVETKTLETLKDKRFEEFRGEAQKHARKSVDEIVVQRYRLTKPGGRR